MRKRAIFVLLAACVSAGCYAADATDSVCAKSVSPLMLRIDKITASRFYQMGYMGVPLVVAGLIIKDEDDHFRELRNDYIPRFRFRYDDYLQYLPAAVMLGMKAGGVQGRSSWGRMLASDALSVAIMATAVNALKSGVGITRPDGTNSHSFPSGHTATAFMTATMLTKEYGARSPWYGVGAYSVASATGLMRMANNKHWLSDVLVGAGIGILSTELGYYLGDLMFGNKGITDFSVGEQYDRLRNPTFFGVRLGFTLMAGRFRLPNDWQVSFSAGGSAGLEGAWFLNPFFGIGGRVGISSMPVQINRVAQFENLDVHSAEGGAFVSYPLTSRWTAGSKLLLGYIRYSNCDFDLPVSVGGRGGLGLGTGASLNFMAHANFGIRFYLDYNLNTSAMRDYNHMLHVIGLGVSANIVF
ncbi:MAG: phosphatase PAP2 family protein [Tannerellaceae bacterium]